MISLKQEKLFVNLFYLDRQQLIEDNVITEDDFFFKQGNEDSLNLYLSLALLTSCNFLPAEMVVDFMYEIIEDNFILDKTDIMQLIKFIRQIGEFSLHEQDFIHVEQIIQVLFNKKKIPIYQSSFMLPTLSLQKAKNKALELIDMMYTHLSKYSQPELNSSQSNLMSSYSHSLSSQIQKKQKNFLSFNFKVYQMKNKNNNNDDNDKNENQLIVNFPSILDGIFERNIILQLFPDESKSLMKFPKKIGKIEGRFRNIQLPMAYRQFVDEGNYKKSDQQNIEANQGNIEQVNNVDVNQNYNAEEQNNEEEEEEQKQNQQNKNNVNPNNKIPNQFPQKPSDYRDEQRVQVIIRDQSQEKKEQDKELKSQFQNKQESIIQYQSAIIMKQKSEKPSKQSDQGLTDAQIQQMKSSNLKNVQPIQRFSIQPKIQMEERKSQEPVNQQEQSSKQNAEEINEIKQNDNYYSHSHESSKWKTLNLDECIDYYNRQMKLEQQMDSQLILNKRELERILNQVWDNIYDITFRAIYFTYLINQQQTEELKQYCEYYILQCYLKLRDRQEKKFFQNCQNMVYVVILLLLVFKNENFYKLFIGAVLCQIEGLLDDQAYHFNYHQLNPNQQEKFLVFQMLILFDNPKYFYNLFSYRDNFLLKSMKTYMYSCYNLKINIQNELKILFNFKNSGEQNQFQKQKICQDYFKLIKISQHEELAYYLLTIQLISNHQSIIDLEKQIDRIPQNQTNQSKKDEDIIIIESGYTDNIKQIKVLYDEIYQKVNFEFIPNIQNISTVNLRAELNQKIDNQIYNQLILDPSDYLKQLKLYQTYNCPNFSLRYLPVDVFGFKMTNSLLEVVQILKQADQGSKEEQQKLNKDAQILYQQNFGSNTNLIIQKLKNYHDRVGCEELKNKYFPVLFFEFYEQEFKKNS